MNKYKVLTIERTTGQVDLEEINAEDWTIDGDNNVYFYVGAKTIAVYRNGYWLSVREFDSEDTTYSV